MLVNPCAACVVSHVLQAEPTIRIALVAGRLSQSLRQPWGAAGPSPILDFWSSSLRRALDDDIFWGPIFWDDIDARASWLEHGIHELMRQCFELESLVPGCKFSRSPPITIGAVSYDGSVIPTKPQSPLIATATTSTSHNSDNWMNRVLLGFWNSLVADAAEMEQTTFSMAHLQPTRDRSHSSFTRPW